MRKGIVVAVALTLVVGAAIAAVPILEAEVAAQIKSEIERDGITKVGKVEVGLFDRSVALIDLKSAGNGGEQTFGRWEASGLAWPWGEVLRGRTPLSGVRLGDPLSAHRLELKDVKLVDQPDGTRLSLQALTIEGLDLARFSTAYQGSFPAQVWTARALANLSLRKLEATNLMVGMPGTGDTFGVATAVVDGYARGRIATLTLNGIEATAKDEPTPLFKVERLSAEGLDWSRLLTGMAADGWFPGAPVPRVRVDGASVTGFGGDMLARHGVSLGSISLETSNDGDKVSRSRTRIQGFVLAPPLRGLQGLQMRLALQTMGLKEVKADLDCAATEDGGKGEFLFGPCALVGPGLGQIDFSARFINVDQAFWRALDDGDVLALNGSAAGLGSAKLVLADKSLLERGLKALSTMTGRPVAETRSNLAREIRLFQPSDVLISQDMTKLLDTVARFVEQGGTLTVDAKPEPPLDIDQLRAMWRPGADLVRLLGLTATLAR